MKRKKLYRRIPELPLLYRLVWGAIGKEYVIKHYSYGAIRTKFPDMSRIVASPEQRKWRDLFKEAVAYSKAQLADKYRKAEWKSRTKKKHRVFNAAIKEYMLREKRNQGDNRIRTNALLHNAFKNDEDGGENPIVNIPKPDNPGPGCDFYKGLRVNDSPG